MHLLRMEGAWSRRTAWLYERVVGAGIAELYDRFAEELAAAVEPGATVIDVGCGQGQIASRLAARRPEARVIGLDLSEAMLGLARAESPRLDNLEFRGGDALALPLDTASVDVAVSVASIKHWPDRIRGVRELVRVLRPGGLLAILECERGCRLEDSKRFVASWRHLAGPISAPLEAWYFRTFVAGQALTLDELVGLLTRAGAVDLEVDRVEGLPFVVGRGRKAS